MEITEVRIFSRDNPATKLRAYATITLDNAFVVRNIKVIEGNKGLFVAMPSRRIEEPCPKCGAKNSLRSRIWTTIPLKPMTSIAKIRRLLIYFHMPGILWPQNSHFPSVR